MKFILRIWWLSLILIAGAPVAAAGEGEFERLKLATFEEVWERVNELYFDPSFGGKDWNAIGDRYRSRLEEVDNDAELEGLLESMLAELESSHFGIVSADAAEIAEGAGWRGGYAGLELSWAGKQIIAFRVDKGGPAWQAGIRPGDAMRAIRGIFLDEVRRSVRETKLPRYLWRTLVLNEMQERLIGAPNEQVEVECVTPSGKKQTRMIKLASYTGRLSSRFGHIGEMPMVVETQRLEGDIAYLRFSIWMPNAMPDIRSYVEQLGSETVGLIIDLRNNPGGIGLMAGGLGGLLVEQQTQLGTAQLRRGHINFVAFPQKNAFLGPVAILINEGSCSTSEIFALGLQEAGRARLFGQPTPGAALASTFSELPNGALLQSVLGDLVTPKGIRLEGRGAKPDRKVPLSPVALADGRDTVVEAASLWILTQLKE